MLGRPSYFLLNLSQNFLSEELAYGLGSNGVEGIVYGNTNALLALAHAEGTAKLYLITEIVLCNEVLKLLNDLTGSLNVAGATDTNSYFKHNFFLTILIRFRIK